ncbi:MAG: chemotaxis protein CheB [Bacteroidota bacterium]|nr:chemotaxis protein CheB [Bacteroidota bacterium]MDP3145499.1 chemotaxis protein CheB [Bacteroidota bacterium]MDP3556459.1 chemotaxis protein CheB [Bacteroidota bacterium]
MEEKEVIIIGGSAGSIDVMMQILPNLPEEFPVPIILVLHRRPSIGNLSEIIFQNRCKIPVLEVEDKMPIMKNTVYLAPGGYHLLVEKNHSFSLDFSEKVNHSRPSIDVTFESVVDIYNDKVIGILLTGANTDGARGLKLIKDSGGYTIIQSPETSMMPMMPEAAESIMKPDQILNPLEISDFLINITKKKCDCCA